MTHIFIVNEKTFKIHLEYMFAGTGYGENQIEFLESNNIDNFATSTEKTYVSMIADISKVRIGDLVAFYVSGCKKIFGFFKVVSTAFFEPCQSNYLGNELDKYLPLRVRIEPYLVYSKGITEHEALDNIFNLKHPYEMCWSLIYRKLTGMRGCSYVTDSEFHRLFDLISAKNDNETIQFNAYTYDNNTKTIVENNKKSIYTAPTDKSLNVLNRLLKVRNSYEVHIQAYIAQNFDKNELKDLLLPKSYIRTWFGNEVVCSVGEQRIDLLTISETKNQYILRLIELKCDTPKEKIINEQIKWYLKWVIQYIAPNISDKPVKIVPTIIALPYTRNTNSKANFIKAFTNFNQNKPMEIENVTIDKMEFISYQRNSDQVSFKKEF